MLASLFWIWDRDGMGVIHPGLEQDRNYFITSWDWGGTGVFLWKQDGTGVKNLLPCQPLMHTTSLNQKHCKLSWQAYKNKNNKQCTSYSYIFHLNNTSVFSFGQQFNPKWLTVEQSRFELTLAVLGFEPRTFQLVVQTLNHWATTFLTHDVPQGAVLGPYIHYYRVQFME